MFTIHRETLNIPTDSHKRSERDWVYVLMDQDAIKNIDMLIQKGENELVIQNYEQALISFQEAYEIDQKNVTTIVNMGFCYAKLNRFSQAEECFITALDQSPHNLVARRNLTRVLHAQGKEEHERSRTSSSFTPFQKSFPDKEEIFARFIEWAQESLKKGSTFSAIQYFEAASHIHPKLIEPYLQIASCYEELDIFEKACAVYERILSIYPDDETAREGKKRCCGKASYHTRDMSIHMKRDDSIEDVDIDEIEISINNDDDENISEDDIIEIEEEEEEKKN